jgi:hypothetical protein
MASPVQFYDAEKCDHFSQIPTRRLGVMMKVVQWFKQTGRSAQPAVARIATAVAFVSTGALAVGAMAIGAYAIGRLAIGRFVVKSGQIDRLVINELEVNSLRLKGKVIEQL